MSTRTRRGELQVATDTYQHTDGRTATLIGMVHVADPAFYDHVAHIVADREQAGDGIQYERIRPCEPGTPMTDAEASLLTRMKAAPVLSILATLLGLDMQHRTRLTVQPHWINTDVTALELLRMLPDPERFVSRNERMPALTDDLDDDTKVQLRRMGRWAVRNLGWLALLFRVTSVFSSRQRRERKAILDRRNTIAIGAITGAGQNVTAMWGAAHLPGIGAGLERHGFRRVGRRWATAVAKTKPRHLAAS